PMRFISLLALRVLSCHGYTKHEEMLVASNGMMRRQEAAMHPMTLITDENELDIPLSDFTEGPLHEPKRRHE
ncbi:unnamed protein product, partial [Effrenium voratum]